MTSMPAIRPKFAKSESAVSNITTSVATLACRAWKTSGFSVGTFWSAARAVWSCWMSASRLARRSASVAGSVSLARETASEALSRAMSRYRIAVNSCLVPVRTTRSSIRRARRINSYRARLTGSVVIPARWRSAKYWTGNRPFPGRRGRT